MLAAFYQTLCYPELLGKNIVIPDTSSEALYLSERGELFCYTGIYSRDKSRVLFESWPYYLSGKHTGDCRKDIRGFFQIKNGCILLTGFVVFPYISIWLLSPRWTNAIVDSRQCSFQNV